ncbi:MATE family efflux transporter [Cohnella suwonensis]|uniref:MATE family efflux transporter n=1 Tax=Cohnella suwonensis TaxID=696072 RepID=A0ABW0LWI3_9BACL
MKSISDPSTPSWRKLSLFAVTWPIFLDTLLRMFHGSADVFMMSQVSDLATGAVGISNEIIYFCITMFGFVGIGTSIVVAQYIGAGREREASRISAHAISINFLFGLIVSAALVVCAEPLMRLLNLDAEQIGIASRYLKIIGGFIWIEALSYAISSIIRSQGRTKDVLFVTLGVNAVHLVGNYLLIFGHAGFPEMGVTGAAVSAVVSRALGIVVLFMILYRRALSPIRLKDYVKWKGEYVKQILGVGLPAAGEHLAWQGQYMMIMSFINIIGVTALSAHIYIMNISHYFFSLAFAIGIGTEIIVGQMVGAGENRAAYERLMRSVKISFVVTLAVVGAAAFFREGIVGLFTEDAEILAMATGILLLSVVLEPGRTFNLVVIASLRAAGDARFPVFVGVISMWGVAVPLAYALGIHYGMGLFGIWIAFAVDEWLRGLIMLLRWKSLAWQRYSLVGPQKEPGAPVGQPASTQSL